MSHQRSVIGFMAGLLVALAIGSHAQVEINVDASKVVGECDNYLWANLGFDPLYSEITAEETRPVLRMIRESGAFRYVRCHNYFSSGLPSGRRNTYYGCRIYSEDADGKPQYEWWFLDEVLDRILAAGLRPIVECDFMPDDLAAGEPLRNYGGGLVNTPKDYKKWRDLVYETVKHCKERYGADEIRLWRWEIWNEPDLYRYFIDGWGYNREGKWTPKMVDRLNRMYDYFVDGAIAADPQIKVGGPGIAGNRQYMVHFLKHVTEGTNYVTGEKGTRIDFISWHGYGNTTPLLMKNKAFLDLIKSDFPQLADREMQMNEWGQPLRVDGKPAPSWSSYSEFEAAFLCRFVDGLYSNPDSMPQMFLKWGRLTGSGMGGWRTLTRYIGDEPVPTPVFHAYALLGRLGPERLAVEQPDWPATARAIATRTGDGVQVLLYRFDEENQDGIGVPEDVKVTIRLIDNDSSSAIYRIDQDHSNFYRAWERAERNPEPGKVLSKRIQAAAKLHVEPLPADSIENGIHKYSVKLPVNSVVLIAVGREHRREFKPDPYIQRILDAEEDLEWARWAATEGDSKRAETSLLKLADENKDLYIGQLALRSLIKLYEDRTGRPADADTIRARLLSTTLGDDERLQLLEARLAFAEKQNNADDVKALQREIEKVRPLLQRRGPWTP